jgi:hypothetical protein
LPPLRKIRPPQVTLRLPPHRMANASRAMAVRGIAATATAPTGRTAIKHVRSAPTGKTVGISSASLRSARRAANARTARHGAIGIATTIVRRAPGARQTSAAARSPIRIRRSPSCWR